jgi:hypothetical protein
MEKVITMPSVIALLKRKILKAEKAWAIAGVIGGRGPHQPDPSLGEGEEDGEGVSAFIVCYMGFLS